MTKPSPRTECMPLDKMMDLLKQVHEDLDREGWNREIWWNTPLGEKIGKTSIIYRPSELSDDITAPEGVLRLPLGIHKKSQGRLQAPCPICEIFASDFFINRRIGLDEFACRNCYAVQVELYIANGGKVSSSEVQKL